MKSSKILLLIQTSIALLATFGGWNKSELGVLLICNFILFVGMILCLELEKKNDN